MNKFLGKNTPSIRESNMELLRVLCMLFIVCGHITLAHKFDLMGDSSYYINYFFRSFAVVAVNVYVLISGYYGIKLKVKKLGEINTMVTVYSVLFVLFSLWVGIHELQIRKDFLFLFPVITKQYWFITVYFVLCFLSPFLNLFIDKIDKKNLERLLLTLFVCFCLLPTFSFLFNFPSITEDAGYGIVNFCFLYLLGRYIRLYYRRNFSKYVYLIGYGIAALGLCIFQLSYSYILGFPFTSLWSYDTFFVFIGAIFLFMYFREIKIRSRLINYVATYALSVYVLHFHPLTFSYFFNDILKVQKYEGWEYVVLLVILPVVIYVVCMGVEFLRRCCFLAIKECINGSRLNRF